MYDLTLDIKLVQEYLNGEIHLRNSLNETDSAYWNETCTPNQNQTEAMWRCEIPPSPNFAAMTFMFLYLPSPQMMNLYTGKASASVLNIFWGLIFLIGGILAIVFKESIGWKKNETSAIELIFVLAPLGFYSLSCGLGNIGKIKSKEHLNTRGKLKYSLELLCTKKMLFYPALFFFSPLCPSLLFRRIFTSI